jgi:hypothetical protein
MHEGKEDADLADVKAVLKKLQRLDSPQEEAAQPAQIATRKVRRSRAAAPVQGIAVFDRKRAAITGASAAKRRLKPVHIYVAGALALVVGVSVMLYGTQFPSGLSGVARSGGDAPAPGRDATMLLTEARRLLREGDILSARKILLTGDPEKRAEFAFTLAQSYDPNYVRSLQRANSSPDRSEAERWYKRWYDLAVDSGLEMENARLMRIINAMH